MDDEDAFAKDEIPSLLKDDLLSRDANTVPIPTLLGKREIGCGSIRSRKYLEQWGEETFIESQKSTLKCQLPGTPKSTFLMVFSPDGTKAASTHGDHNIYVTDVQTGKCICTLKGHPRTPWSVAFHPSSNEIIASGCLDGQVRVWDLKGGSEVWTPDNDKKHVIASLAFHPSDQVLVIATDHELYFWDWFCPEPFAKISTGSIREKVKFVKFDPLGYKLITGIANVRHDRRFETLGVGLASGSGSTSASSRHCSSANRGSNFSWSNRSNRSFLTRNDRRDPPSYEPLLTSSSTPGEENNFSRIIRELRERGRSGASSNESADPSLLDFRNMVRPSRGSSTSGAAATAANPPEEEPRVEPRIFPLLRPVSDDSASSSSLDSSSSVTSGVSGASHERNTRLSLLWTSRLNRTGNDSDNSLGGGFDLEERRGEGSVMRRDDSRRSGRETPEGSRRETPEPPRRETPERSRRRDDGETRGRDESDYRRRGAWRDPRLIDFQARIRMRTHSAHTQRPSDSGGDQGGDSDSGAPRSGGQGGRWMYYRGKFHGRSSAGPSRPSRLPQEPDPLATPGPSGISSGPCTSRQESPRIRNRSLLDPHFGVQLLSRHIANMQRICRSLSLPRAQFELNRHRHEINRLQQIRSMLYDIQHQIQSLRTSVDQTFSEDFPSAPPVEPTYSTLREEDPDQVASALLSTTQDQPMSSPAAETAPEISSSRPPTARHTTRLAPRARHLARCRLQRAAVGMPSRVRQYRHRVSLPWLVRRMLSHRRTTRNRMNLPAPVHNSDEVQITRTSVGMSNQRTRAAPQRRSMWTDREPRRRPVALSSRRTETGARAPRRPSQSEPSSNVRQRHSGDWQRRMRSIAAHQEPSPAPPSAATAPPLSPSREDSEGALTRSAEQALQTAIIELESLPSSIPLRDRSMNRDTSNPPPTPGASRHPARRGANAPPTDLFEDFQQFVNSFNSSVPELPADSSRDSSQPSSTLRARALNPLPNPPRQGSPDSLPDLERRPPPITPLSSRIAQMLHREEELARESLSTAQSSSTEAASTATGGARPRVPPWSSSASGRSRAGWSVFGEVDNFPSPGEADFFSEPAEEGGEDGDRRPFLQNLRTLRREIMTHHQRAFRRASLVTGRDLAGATLDAIDSDRERFRAERRDRYRVILERMAERLNSLMNRSLLTHSHRLQQEIEQEFVELSGEAPNMPPRNPSVTAALDNHMHNLRLLVRLALHLIYQLLNFICNQNISYEERPISRLPNPFREEQEPSSGADPSLDMELEPGLRNLTNLLETVRMASVELRNDVMEGTSSRTSGRTLSSAAVRRRLTNFLYRDLGSPPPLEEVQRPLPRSPMVIPQLLLNDLTMDGSAPEPPSRGGASAEAPPPMEDPLTLPPPLRVLERQNAVDRFSPDLEEPEPEQGDQEGGNGVAPPDVPLVSMGRHPFRLFPSTLNNNQEASRSPEHNMYFSRPLFNHYVASRNISGPSNPTHRIQAWDFSSFQLPDISDTFSNIVVPKCKIHFDASVSISDDGNLLAALIPESQPLTRVSVYSLETKTLGQVLFSSVMDSNTICVSISPTMKHLVVGIASFNHRLGVHGNNNEKQVVASVYKIGEQQTGRNQALGFVKNISLERDHRQVSLNCIRWMPFPGQGLIYGTNRGQLTILR